jgi:lysophospholipase L1-like esterase
MKTLKYSLLALVAGALCLATIAALFLAVLPYQGAAQQNGTTTPPDLDDSVNVVAFGDSLSLGVGATAGNDYVSILERRAQINIINESVAGDTTEEALARLERDVLDREPDIVILFLGGNDILELVPLTETLANLETMIDEIQDVGATVILVGAHGESFSDVRDAQFESLADETGAIYVPDALEDIIGNPALLSDAVHPNNAGYLIIAERIWPALQEALNEEYPDRDLSVTCEGFPFQTATGDDVTWTAYVWGGDPDDYEFDWTGQDIDEEDTESITVNYLTPGEKTAQVTVTSGNLTETADCRDEVVVTDIPLVGVCEVEVEVSSEGVVTVNWFARAAGGRLDIGGDLDNDGIIDEDERLPLEFTWSGANLNNNDADADDEGSFISQQYATAGRQEATVTITSGDQEIELPCVADFTNIDLDGFLDDINTADPDNPDQPRTDVDDPLTGSCAVAEGSFSIFDAIEWSADADDGFRNEPDDNQQNLHEFQWTGSDGLVGNTSDVTMTYEDPGLKTGEVTIIGGDERLELQCAVLLSDVRLEGTGDGCFIATAAYGTYGTENNFIQEVNLLRRFRDEKLLTNDLGRSFVDFYYNVSPPIADKIAKNESAKAATRAVLAPVVWAVDLVQD